MYTGERIHLELLERQLNRKGGSNSCRLLSSTNEGKVEEKLSNSNTGCHCEKPDGKSCLLTLNMGISCQPVKTPTQTRLTSRQLRICQNNVELVSKRKKFTNTKRGEVLLL